MILLLSMEMPAILAVLCAIVSFIAYEVRDPWVKSVLWRFFWWLMLVLGFELLLLTGWIMLEGWEGYKP